MLVTVKLFAGARELADCDAVAIEVRDDATVADVKRSLAQRFPQLERLLARSMVARNQEYATEEEAVRAADELALIPPVSGG